MYRSTTPTVILKIKNEDFDLSLIDICHITIESENGMQKLIIENPTLDEENKEITFTLTQEQTLAFSVGSIKVQIKAKLQNGTVIPSKMLRTKMNEILEQEVL